MWSIAIGEKVFDDEVDDSGRPIPTINIVQDESYPEMPGFKTYTPALGWNVSNSNYVSMNNPCFSRFVDDTGLELPNTHEGYDLDNFKLLTNSDGIECNRVLKAYQTAHPELEPSMANWESGVLAYLIWFEFWVIKALETLKEPYIKVW